MRNLILAVLLIGLSVNVYGGTTDPTKTGVSETDCKSNLDYKNRVSIPAVKADEKVKKPAAKVIDKG